MAQFQANEKAAGSNALAAGYGSGESHRLALFILGSRVIDFDTFLPTAMQLKEQHPDWSIKFITYARANYDFIQRNPALIEGLRRCGSLHYVGSGGSGNSFKRLTVRIRELARISGWILRRHGPVLFASRPFTSRPVDLFYILARLRRGVGVLLWKSRSPDRVHHIVWQNREQPAYEKGSLLSRMGKRDIDAVIYYHPDQMENLQLVDRFGRIDGVPRFSIGFPHLFPAWQKLIAQQTQTEREKLEAEGVAEDAEYYAMFAAKPYSAVNLRSADAIERVFKQVLKAVCELRPRAVVLIRPHPLAINEPYIQEAIDSVGKDRARVSFAHPEVLMALSRRALFNNPTNIMFSCFRAKMIDCSDYAENHYQELGEVSLADGYGPLFINPLASDFQLRLARLLKSDSEFSDASISREREKLLTENPADLSAMIAMLEKFLPHYRSA